MRYTSFVGVLSVALVLTLLAAGEAEQKLRLLQGKLLTEDGAPVTNQPIVIEGYADWSMWHKVLVWRESDLYIVQAVTDKHGEFQVLNLPAGSYTLKALRPGTAPIPIKDFKWDGGNSKKEIRAEVSLEQLGRQSH